MKTTLTKATALFALATSSLWAVNVEELTIGEILDDYSEGNYTAVELTQAYLDRIALYDPLYKAFSVLNADALTRAAELDSEYAMNGAVGPLHGVPIVIKDNIDIAGINTTGGYFGFSTAAGGLDINPDVDSTIVERLQAAGAIILGKTKLPAFAIGIDVDTYIDGVSLNPYALDRAPGASSTGSGVAVNANFATAAIGSDTTGSIMGPSAVNGLIGFIPTSGLVPGTGVFPLRKALDVAGPMARTVEDTAIVLDAISGFDSADPTTSLASSIIPQGGFAANLSDTSLQGKVFATYDVSLIGFGVTDPEVSARFQEAVALIEAQGATVVDVTFSWVAANASSILGLLNTQTAIRQDTDNFGTIFSYELNEYLQRFGNGANFTSMEEYGIESGLTTELTVGGNTYPTATIPTQEAYEAAHEAFLTSHQSFTAFMEAFYSDNNFDGFFLPAGTTKTGTLLSGGSNFETLWTLFESPGVTVPMGLLSDGSPFSVFFVGPKGSDAETLSYAYDYEQATLERVIPTLVLDSDEDGDLLFLGDEFREGADPLVADSDNDGVDDGDEVFTYFTEAAVADTDGDGLDDGSEVDNGLDPLTDSAVTDVITAHLETLRRDSASLALSQPAIFIENGQVVLQVQMSTSSDLQNFTPLGDPIEVATDLPEGESASFYKLGFE